MKLKLTNRERTLLIIAGICFVAAILYYAVIKPQTEAVSRLENQAREYSTSLSDIMAKADPGNPVYKENSELNEQTQKLLQKYYPVILQEKIILLLNEKISKTNIKVAAMSFSEPSLVDLQEVHEQKTIESSELNDLVTQINDGKILDKKEENSDTAEEKEPLRVEKMTVSLTIQGSYNEIYSFLKELEEEKRSIFCSSLNIAAGSSSLLTCDAALDFYAIPKPFVQDQDFFNWSIEGQYGKENPFE